MSKFYVQGNVSDDSDSEDEQKNINIDKNNKKRFDVDDDDYHFEEKGRVIVAEREKKKALFKKISNAAIAAANIKDFDKSWDAIQEMLKEIEKSAKFIEKQGLPSSFLKAIKLVNQQVNKIDGEAKKSLKNSKSLNILKQKLKNKIIPEYKDKLENFKEEETEEQSSEQEIVSSSDESEDEFKKYLDSPDPHIRRKYWLIREAKETKDQSDTEKKEKVKEEKVKEDKEEETRRKASQPDKPKYKLAEAKKKKQETHIASAQDAQKKVASILKEYNKLASPEKREEYLETLNVILKQSRNYKDHERISLLLVDIPIRIEVTRQITRQMNEPYFSRENWLRVFENIQEVFQVLRETEDEDLLDKMATFNDTSSEANLGTTEKDVYAQIKSFINSLERELSRSFDYLESSELEYSERLQDLIKFIEFMYKVSKEMSFKEGLEREAAEVSFKVLEHMYYMSNFFMEKIKQTNPELEFIELGQADTLQEFTKPILRLSSSDYTTKTLLYLIYNHAVNRRDKGKDLLVMTDLSQAVVGKDYYTQICFNRALVQLGISAFHQGNLFETQQILSYICSLGKSREENKEAIKRFLGQAKLAEGSTTRHKILPYYLHFNIDLVEAIQLIASMVLEIPFTLIEGNKITSKTFKKVAYQYERSHFIAEPLNYRDLVYAASSELKLGNMEECLARLSEIDIWNEMGNPQEALKNLRANIRETALKCYILANRDCFRCISLAGLSARFGMQEKAVRKLICREINDRKIEGTLTDDGFLNLADKRKLKESGLRSIANNLFDRLEEISRNSEAAFKQAQETAAEEEEDHDKDANSSKRTNDVLMEKLRHILSRRGA